jgi:lipopolysaccharide export system ATP-binding protein
MLFEGKIQFKGTPEELSENEIVRRKYLGVNFELKKKPHREKAREKVQEAVKQD